MAGHGGGWRAVLNLLVCREWTVEIKSRLFVCAGELGSFMASVVGGAAVFAAVPVVARTVSMRKGWLWRD